MKKKLTALALVLALCVSLAGCTFSTPASVGKIGDVEIGSGLYLLAQYGAYQQALGLADDDQKQLSVSKLMNETIYVDEDETAAEASSDSAASGEAADSSASSEAADAAPTGTPWNVRDYIAAETLKSLQFYAAVETRFAALGGELTEAELTSANQYAQQLMDSYGDTYTANGIALSTVQAYEQNMAKASALLELVYGADGETPVSDDALTDHLQNDMVYGYYVTVPLYSTTTYTFADEDGIAEMTAAAQSGIDAFNSLQSQEATAEEATAEETTAEETTAGASTTALANFYTALTDCLPEMYSVVGDTYDPSASLSSDLAADLFTESDFDSYFSDEAKAEIRTLEYNEAAVVRYSSYSLMLFLRLDPLESNQLDTLRATILNDMVGVELSDSLYAYGAQELTNALEQSSMNKLPAKKIEAAAS